MVFVSLVKSSLFTPGESSIGSPAKNPQCLPISRTPVVNWGSKLILRAYATSANPLVNLISLAQEALQSSSGAPKSPGPQAELGTNLLGHRRSLAQTALGAAPVLQNLFGHSRSWSDDDSGGPMILPHAFCDPQWKGVMVEEVSPTPGDPQGGRFLG